MAKIISVLKYLFSELGCIVLEDICLPAIFYKNRKEALLLKSIGQKLDIMHFFTVHE